MQCGQTMSAIGISNSNQSDLVQCVYIATYSFPNHTAQISVIFMHAWVSNIMISYKNIWIQLTLIMTSPSLLHPHIGLLFIIVPLTFSHACMHTQYQSALSIAHAIFFFRSVSHEGTHPHTSPSPSYRAFFISHACMHNDRCSSMCVCI